MKRIHCLICAFVFAGLQGCISFYPTGSLGTPAPLVSTPFPYSAMVDQVVVSDARINNDAQVSLGHQLGNLIRQHLREGHYFQRVIAFPAKMGEDDVLLKFNFSSFYAKRRPHPGYFPGALLTFTVWLWANGPIYVDSYELTGELIIEDVHGNPLAISRKTVTQKENVGLWDENYVLYRGQQCQPLSQLVEELLQEAFGQLQNSKGIVR